MELDHIKSGNIVYRQRAEGERFSNDFSYDVKTQFIVCDIKKLLFGKYQIDCIDYYDIHTEIPTKRIILYPKAIDCIQYSLSK